MAVDWVAGPDQVVAAHAAQLALVVVVVAVALVVAGPLEGCCGWPARDQPAWL